MLTLKEHFELLFWHVKFWPTDWYCSGNKTNAWNVTWMYVLVFRWKLNVYFWALQLYHVPFAFISIQYNFDRIVGHRNYFENFKYKNMWLRAAKKENKLDRLLFPKIEFFVFFRKFKRETKKTISKKKSIRTNRLESRPKQFHNAFRCENVWIF